MRAQVEKHLEVSDADPRCNMSLKLRQQIESHIGLADDEVDDEDAKIKALAKTRNKMARPEEEAGKMLVEWIDLLVMANTLRPGLFFYHVPNGLARTATQGGLFKAQGLRKGWPDYCLDLPLGGYHGLRLELKSLNGSKPSPEQLEILARLESVGFKCAVAWGFDDARQQIEKYLDLAS